MIIHINMWTLASAVIPPGIKNRNFTSQCFVGGFGKDNLHHLTQFNFSGVSSRTSEGTYLVVPQQHSLVYIPDKTSAAANPSVGFYIGSRIPGYEDGDISSAKFLSPSSVVVASSDTQSHILYVADRGNNVIRKLVVIQPTLYDINHVYIGQVETIAGQQNRAGLYDDFFANALFNQPERIGIDYKKTSLLILDSGGFFRVLNLISGIVTTLPSAACTGNYENTFCDLSWKFYPIKDLLIPKLGFFYCKSHTSFCSPRSNLNIGE